MSCFVTIAGCSDGDVDESSTMNLAVVAAAVMAAVVIFSSVFSGLHTPNSSGGCFSLLPTA